MKICVLCRTAGRTHDDPRAFHLGHRRHLIVAVLGRWAEPPHNYFEVRVQDGRRFVLCHDAAKDAWELAAALPKGGQAPRAPHWRLVSVFGAMRGWLSAPVGRASGRK